MGKNTCMDQNLITMQRWSDATNPNRESMVFYLANELINQSRTFYFSRLCTTPNPNPTKDKVLFLMLAILSARLFNIFYFIKFGKRLRFIFK